MMMKAILWTVTAGILLAVAGTFLVKYDQWFVFPEKRAYVNNNLRDPASTQYRNERMTKSGWLCGELNSKNGNGGYVGFKRFMAGSSDDAYLEGIGYAGTGQMSTARVIDRLEREAAHLKALNSLPPEVRAVSMLSRNETRELVTKEIFEEKWQANCAS
jgi:hypothetical protein